MRVEEEAVGARAREIVGCHPRWRGPRWETERRGEETWSG